ncbi:hypothetical protein HK405_010074, partial [Cladochytrium tenue]
GDPARLVTPPPKPPLPPYPLPIDDDHESTAARAAAELLAAGPSARPADAEAAARARLGWWQRGRLPPLLDFRRVPRYMQDNPFVVRGYRAAYSFRENWISLAHCHNESVNVWSHLLAAAAFSGLAAAVAAAGPRPIAAAVFGVAIDPPTSVAAEIRDTAVLAAFFGLSAFTYLTSMLYHTHLSHSLRAYVFFGCWDYSGISAGVLATTSSVLQYLLACDPIWLWSWQVLAAVANTAGVIGPVFPFWGTAEFRPARTAIYVLSAVISTFPIAHFLAVYGPAALPSPFTNFALPGYACMALSYAVGIVVYVGRIPER